MDKYIKQLLEQYSKVILPKFGAIVIEDEESGELMFNEYLNYNDGKLDELIESESNMGTQEAQNMIAKYIRDIQAQIDKGESYDIFGLGSFIKNKDGEVEFSGNIKTGASQKTSEPAGPSPTPEPTKKEEKAPEKKEQKSAAPKSEKKENKYVAPAPDTKKEQVESNNKKEVKKPEDKTEKTEKKAVEKKQDSKANKDKAKKDKEAAKKKEKEEKERAKKDKQKAKEDAKKAKADKKKKAAATKNKPNQTEEGKKKKKKVGVLGWVVIVLLLIVATGSILVGLNYEEVKTYMGWDEFKDKKELAHNDISPSTNETNEVDQEDDNNESDSGEEDLESSSDEASNDLVEENEGEDEGNEADSESSTQDQENIEEKEPVVEEPVKEEPVKETPVVSNTSSGSYHLIAGGFREKSNADDAVSELRTKGLDAKIIGRINGLHFVSAKSYNSLNAAKQDMNNVRSKAPGAWIYKQ